MRTIFAAVQAIAMQWSLEETIRVLKRPRRHLAVTRCPVCGEERPIGASSPQIIRGISWCDDCKERRKIDDAIRSSANVVRLKAQA